MDIRAEREEDVAGKQDFGAQSPQVPAQDDDEMVEIHGGSPLKSSEIIGDDGDDDIRAAELFGGDDDETDDQVSLRPEQEEPQQVVQDAQSEQNMQVEMGQSVKRKTQDDSADRSKKQKSFEEQVREAMRYARSGRPMPVNAAAAEGKGERDQHMDNLEASRDMVVLAKVLLGVDVTEVYSPERVVRVCSRYGLAGGSSMDLTTGWNFDNQGGREEG